MPPPLQQITSQPFSLLQPSQSSRLDTGSPVLHTIPGLIHCIWKVSNGWQTGPLKGHFSLWHSGTIKMHIPGGGIQNRQTCLYCVHCNSIYGPWSLHDCPWQLTNTAQHRPESSLVLPYSTQNTCQPETCCSHLIHLKSSKFSNIYR